MKVSHHKFLVLWVTAPVTFLLIWNAKCGFIISYNLIPCINLEIANTKNVYSVIHPVQNYLSKIIIFYEFCLYGTIFRRETFLLLFEIPCICALIENLFWWWPHCKKRISGLLYAGLFVALTRDIFKHTQALALYQNKITKTSVKFMYKLQLDVLQGRLSSVFYEQNPRFVVVAF